MITAKRSPKVITITPEEKRILGEAIELLAGVANGRQYNRLYFVGITMASESILKGIETGRQDYRQTAISFARVARESQ